MPVYEYRCQECGESTSLLRSMSKRDNPLPCSVCGGECKPEFSVPSWRWGPMAAAHGAFVEETRPGYHGINHETPKPGRGGTREELMSR